MEILIIGTEVQSGECRQKFGSLNTIQVVQGVDSAAEPLKGADVVFDFVTPADPLRIREYGDAGGPAVFFDSSLVRLRDLLEISVGLNNRVFGFCGLRTFVNREILEVTTRGEADRTHLESICTKLGTACQVVADQAGMVTPRVICMIINEAYYTLEEGTASRQDIDLAMKLGTNYPWGPFEWGERIGLGNVVKILEAVWKETGDTRYEVCTLMRHSV